MALPSFLKRKNPAAAQPRSPADGVDVQQARTRARRRLIGAAVLLAVGVIAFPLLFETQPRPIPVDIPIEIPRKEAVAPLAAPPRVTRPASAVPVEPAARAVVEAAAPSASATAPAVAAPAPPAAERSRVVAASAPTPAKEPPGAKPPAADAARAQAAPDGRPTAQTAAAAAAPAAEPKVGRFVVQVGAFAEASAAREVRLKVERLGLKTYTQVVDTEAGKRTRVRIGPFESRDEAAKALDKLKAANLPGAVLAL